MTVEHSEFPQVMQCEVQISQKYIVLSPNIFKTNQHKPLNLASSLQDILEERVKQCYKETITEIYYMDYSMRQIT